IAFFALGLHRQALLAPKTVVGFASKRVAAAYRFGDGVTSAAAAAFFGWHGALLAFGTVFNGNGSNDLAALGTVHRQDTVGIPDVHSRLRVTPRMEVNRRLIAVRTEGVGALQVVKIRTVQESGHHSLLVAFVTLQPLFDGVQGMLHGTQAFVVLHGHGL